MSRKQKTLPPAVHIRWMIRADMPQVLRIEEESFEFPWVEDDYIRCLRQRNCIGTVAECDGVIVGFMVYELHRTRLHLLNFAVVPGQRLQGIGRAMVAKLIGKLSDQRRTRIQMEVRETNLDALLFLKRLGFQAVSVLRDFYNEKIYLTSEDAYLMQFRFRAGVAAT